MSDQQKPEEKNRIKNLLNNTLKLYPSGLMPVDDMILNLVHETQRLRESDVAQEAAALGILDAAVMEIIGDKEMDDTTKLGQLAMAVATFSYVRDHHHQNMKAAFEEERSLMEVGLDMVTMH